MKAKIKKIIDLLKSRDQDIKSILKIFLIAFIFNLSLLFIVNIFSNHLVSNGIFFNADTSRVYDDMTSFDANHYRTKVHPLFVLLTQPFVLVLKKIFGELNAVVIYQALIGSFCVVLFYLILRKLNKREFKLRPFMVLFILSFPQVVFSVIFETYIYAELGLLFMWLVGLYLIKKKSLSYLDFLLLILAGVFSMSITVTNFAQFVFLLFFIIFFNKSLKNKFITFCSIIFFSVAITTFFACIQNLIWKSAPNFFTVSVSDFLINKNSEEFLYVSKSFSLDNLLLQIRTSTISQMSFMFQKHPMEFIFYYNLGVNILAIALFSIFVLMNILFIKKHKDEIIKHRFYLSILTAYCFNFVFHIFYGYGTNFLYTLDYTFLILLIVFYIISNYYGPLYNKLSKFKRFYSYAYYIFIILQILGIIYFLHSTFVVLGFAHTMPKKLFIVILLAIITLILISIKKRHVALITILLISLCLVSGIKLINNKMTYRPIRRIESLTEAGADFKVFTNNPENIKLVASLADYYYELNTELTHENFELKKFEDTNKKYSDIFFFGMVDREKILYKNGKLIDMNTKKVLKEFNYTHELIIPNEYTVMLANKDGVITKIYENEDGVYVEEGEKKETITTGNAKFKLPRLENQKYPNVMRVLHQEILFNFDGIIPKPNLIGYKKSTNAWYRDTMLVTMVLEQTNNTHLLEPWLASVNDIYDCQRAHLNGDKNCLMKEADNPGELLYILGAVKNNRKDLVEKIIKEVKAKAKNGLFVGIVDNEQMDYYPTSLLLLGAKKNNIDLSNYLRLPETLDLYGSLSWWDKDTPRINIKTYENRLYPYLEWAQIHYHGSGFYGTLHILDEYYPLSYESGVYDFVPEAQMFISEHYNKIQDPVLLSHTWHASEMFLLMNDL